MWCFLEASRRVLFVCVENSFRSQIAEAYFNAYAPEGWAAVSAGIKPSESVHPNAVKLMLEEGIDISGKKPRLLDRELQEQADLAVIVCSGSQCPVVYAKKVLEWNIPDPAGMPLEEARKIRDEIKRRVLELVEFIKRRESRDK
ncbi:MAG: arsenate reductase ArsC [Nitrososphaerota archaeon]